MAQTDSEFVIVGSGGVSPRRGLAGAGQACAAWVENHDDSF